MVLSWFKYMCVVTLKGCEVPKKTPIQIFVIDKTDDLFQSVIR